MTISSHEAPIRLEASAPAKINLALHITGRRPDGYHELDSIFLPLSYCDQICVAVGPSHSREISCRCAGMPELEGANNLAARAASAYLEAAGANLRVEIDLKKRIWTAAGLGGGSSDAAAVLLLLERHLALLGPRTLGELACRLGADVTFFLQGQPARVRGVGDELAPLVDFPTLPILLCNPGVPLSTAAVYAQFARMKRSTADWHVASPVSLPGSFASKTPHTLAPLVHNDLEAPARALCPAIGPLLDRLRDAGALAAAVSGSGATVFGLFADMGEVERAAALMREPGDCHLQMAQST